MFLDHEYFSTTKFLPLLVTRIIAGNSYFLPLFSIPGRYWEYTNEAEHKEEEEERKEEEKVWEERWWTGGVSKWLLMFLNN